MVSCQAASILVTWSLWQVRDASHAWPNLPLIQFVPQFGMGWILLFSLLLILARPGWGLATHATALAVSIVQDEARLQPEFLSLAILLVGTLPGRWTAEFARAHLGSLWLWAGLHKLISDGYWTAQGMQFVEVYWPEAPLALCTFVCAVVIVSELFLGLGAFTPKGRRLIPYGATLVHGGALLWLAGQSWNYAVWPWQIGIIAAAWSFFGEPAKQRQQMNDDERSRGDRSIRWLFATMMVGYPVLYYANLLPPAPAWCVYSGNVPTATLFHPVEVAEDGLPQMGQGTYFAYGGFKDLNVPYPTMPSSCHRFLQYGREEAWIVLYDPRPLSRWRGRGWIVLTKTAHGVRVDVETPPFEATSAELE